MLNGKDMIGGLIKKFWYDFTKISLNAILMYKNVQILSETV